MRITIAGKPCQTAKLPLIGEGGEAEIFELPGGLALKLFKRPDHPSYQHDATAKTAAAARLAEHQSKLRDFPTDLPDHVARPADLALDDTGMVAGYVMARIGGAEVLMQYGQPAFRRGAGLPNDGVSRVLLDLHATVRALHQRNMVIGDFNDLNVLVKDEAAWLIDADSMQFGGYLTQVFTARFVDPRLCRPDAMVLARPHDRDSDWYAFAVMLFQSLLLVGPFGGVHKPPPGKSKIAHDRRPLHRLSVFSPEVIYPKPAVPYGRLPDDLLHQFHGVFERDRRGEFPRDLLQSLRWTTCPACGAEHARAVCPACGRAGPAVVTRIKVRGGVTAERLFRTTGVLLEVDVSSGALRVLHHEQGAFRREPATGLTVPGDLAAGNRYALCGARTVFAHGNQMVTVHPDGRAERTMVDTFLGRIPACAANARRRFWLRGGAILADGELGPDYPERIATALEGRTRLWAGDRLGFALYLTAAGAGGVVFETEGRGTWDVTLPRLADQVVSLSCRIADAMILLWVEGVEGGARINRCFALDGHGRLLGQAESAPDAGGWLANTDGPCAIGGFLLVATDAGIVRVEPDPAGGLAVTREFPDTAPFVDANTRLYPGRDGLYAASVREIVRLTLAANP